MGISNAGLERQRQDRLVQFIQLKAPPQIIAEGAALVLYSHVGGRHWKAAWWMVRRAARTSLGNVRMWFYSVRYRMFGYDPVNFYGESEADDDDLREL